MGNYLAKNSGKGSEIESEDEEKEEYHAMLAKLSKYILENIFLYIPTENFDKLSSISQMYKNILHSREFLEDYSNFNDLPILGIDDLYKDVTKPILYADIFMYPNSPMRAMDEYDWPVEPYIEIWATDSFKSDGYSCDNWARHKHINFENNPFPDYFPLYIFYHKKEGDIVKFIHNRERIYMRLSQSIYRYGPQTFDNLIDYYVGKYNFKVGQEIKRWVNSEEFDPRCNKFSNK